MKVRTLSFDDDKDRKPALYSCGKCGTCYSPKAYACAETQAHKAVQRAAEECCAPRHCSGCGVEVEKYWTACQSCREKNRLRKAEPIPEKNWSDPVEHEGMPGGWGEGYFSDTDDLRQSCDDYDVKVPAYCWPCVATPLALNANSLLEQATDEMHEDAADEIVDADELVAFIEAWNAKQTCVTWYPDYSRVVVLDRDRFDALIT